MTEYMTTSTEYVNLDGDVVETSKERWMTAVELMAQRDPDTDWHRVEDVKRLADITVVGDKIACYAKWSLNHADEIRGLKPQIIALDAAETEIAKAQAESRRSRMEQMDEISKFERAWENGEC